VSNESYSLTPKGWLCVQLGCDDAKAEEIWNGLREFVREKAIANGSKDGIPALIFDGGGVCQTATKGAQ
jgi:hypothetical protein